MLVLHKLNDVDSMTTLDLEDSDWAVTHAYNGFDTLEFEVPSNSKYYEDLHEECRVTFIGSRCRDMRFIVKNVDEHSHFVTVDCDIDLDEWKASVIQSFRTVNSTLDTVMGKLLPSGWSKSGMEKFPQRTTVEKTEGEPIEAATPLEILDYVTEAYGCVFNFDNINKVIYALKPDDEEATGEYVSDELNLTSRPGFVGNSSGFATRLYAYGKKDEDTDEPLTFADINDGKEYVEDFGYSDKIVCVGWSDERYTVKEDLLEAAKEKLAEVSKPTRSYSCSIAQLNYNVWMYRVVVLLDTVRNIRVDHQVVEWVERAKSSLDEITLSAVAPTIESLIKKTGNVDEKIEQSSQDTKDAYTKAIEDASKRIAGSYGGYFKWIFDTDGNPMELVNLADSEDVSKASRVWRWNKEGLGHSNSGYDGTYDLALMADGSINASMITVGIIQGGNSYWNLNTGELSLKGTFEASYSDSSSGITQALIVEPSFEQYDIDDPTVKSYGPALVFATTESGSKAAYVARTVKKSGKYDVSSLELNGGGKSFSSPGGFMRVGSNRQNNTQAIDGEFYAMASADYLNNSNYKASLLLRARKGGGLTSASLQAADDNGYVGIEANINEGTLHLGGFLGGITGRTTFAQINWFSYQTATAFSHVYFSGTLSSPAKYGYYIPYAQVDTGFENSHFIISAVSDKTASGWRAWTLTFPQTVTTPTGSAILFNSFTYMLYTIGILHE